MKLRVMYKIFVFFIVLLAFHQTCFAASHKYKYKDGGLIYTNVRVPVALSYNINNDTSFCTDTDVMNLKKGTSSRINFLRLVEKGDSGIRSAALSANITEIHCVEQKRGKVYVPFIIPIQMNGYITVVYGK